MIKNLKLKIKNSAKTFLAVNFGCRVNAAETNHFSQNLINQGFTLCRDAACCVSTKKSPNLIFINTCAVTKKGEYESLSKIKKLSSQFPHAKIIATGCADLSKLKDIPNLQIISRNDIQRCPYTSSIGDSLGKSKKYLLKIQSGCTQMCSYCIVPYRRPTLWSLPISDALTTVNQALKNGYQEIIITGVNLQQYQYGLSHLLEALLTQTQVPLISFGSLPLNCIDDKFLQLLSTFNFRLSNYLHIPIQSGSDKILRLMHRPYTKKRIADTFDKLKAISPLVKEGIKGRLDFATDIIVGFPTETDADFQETLDLCWSIGFSKIHIFRYSPRPNTAAKTLFDKSPKIKNSLKLSRSKILRSIT